MASLMFFVLGLLCAFAQAHYVSEAEDDGFGGLLTDKLFKDKSVTANPYINVTPECFNTLVTGFFVAREAWNLKNRWSEIPLKRETDLQNCNILKNPSEQQDCIARVELWAKEAKSGCYRSGFALTVGAVIIGVKVKPACFPSKS